MWKRTQFWPDSSYAPLNGVLEAWHAQKWLDFCMFDRCRENIEWNGRLEDQNGAKNSRHTISDWLRGEQTQCLYLTFSRKNLYSTSLRDVTMSIYHGFWDRLVRALSARSHKGQEVTPYSPFILDCFTYQYFIHQFGVNIWQVLWILLWKSWHIHSVYKTLSPPPPQRAWGWG